MPVKYNPDNNVQLRGRVLKNDFTDDYKVHDGGITSASIRLSCFNSFKANNREAHKYVTDVVYVRFFGHVKDEEHPNGGLLERFLSVASKKNTICIYGHIVPVTYEYETSSGKRRLILNTIICDTFRCEGLNRSEMKEKFMNVPEEYEGLASIKVPRRGRKKKTVDSSNDKEEQVSEETIINFSTEQNVFSKYVNEANKEE